MTRIQSTTSLSGIQSGSLLAYHSVLQDPTLTALNTFIFESHLPITAAQSQTLATTQILYDLVTQGSINQKSIDLYLNHLSDGHAHPAQVAVLKATAKTVDYSFRLRPQHPSQLKLPLKTIVQKYPLSIPDQVKLMKAAIQEFQKNHQTTSLTSYLFLIDATVKIAEKPLHTISEHYPTLNPKLIGEYYYDTSGIYFLK